LLFKYCIIPKVYLKPVNYLMLNIDVVSKVLNLAGSGGADFAEIYVERWRSKNLRLIDKS